MELTRLDLNTLEKLFRNFLEKNETTKSRIAMHIGLNYNNCNKYLDWMSKRQFIIISKNNDEGIIRLSPKGRTFFELLFDKSD